MVPRSRWFALAVLAGLLICLCGSQPLSAQNSNVTITLSMGSNGSCTQNGSTAVIDVKTNQTATYVGPTSTTPFQVTFSSTSCPFNTCTITGSTGAQSPKSGTAGNTYSYTGITINGQSCSNGAGLMIRVKTP